MSENEVETTAQATSGTAGLIEKVAQFYHKALKSNIADVKQCTLDSDADHIIAASFLRKFIEGDMPWVHIDLSAGNHKGGLAHIPTDITGFGVRFSLNLLLNQKAM